MGRAKPNKPRRQRHWVDDAPVDEAGMMEEVGRIGATVDDHGRILFWNDPAINLGEIATGLDLQTGRLTTEPGETGQLPAALFEPARAVMAGLPGEPPKETQVEGAIQAGLRRFPLRAASIQQVAGWELHRLPDDRLELRDAAGAEGVWSRISVPLDPAWISAALHHGYVLCIYGTQLGVRTPPGMPADRYTANARLEEFQLGRGRGFTAAGLVTFRNNR